jgi:hypothetical protein
MNGMATVEYFEELRTQAKHLIQAIYLVTDPGGQYEER